MKKGKKWRHDSMYRSKVKKRYRGRLPTAEMTDPFIGTFYYNKNGRIVKTKEEKEHGNNN